MRPLNGTKTHPLSDFSRAKLRELAKGPIPACKINPGVIDRLLREELAECRPMESPFSTVKGMTRGVWITGAGLSEIAGGKA